MIKLKYSSVDSRGGKWRSFKSLKKARTFAQYWIGKNPTIGSTYAVSDDGVGKIEAKGVALAELFGDDKPAQPATIYIVNAVGKYFSTREEAEAEIKACIEHDPEGCYGPYDIQEETAP